MAMPTMITRPRDSVQLGNLSSQKIEREAAQVSMLGKLLWRIFEGRSSINYSLGTELPREQNWDHEFPEFRQTPIALRPYIQACTAGAPEWKGRFRSLVRRGDKLYTKGIVLGNVNNKSEALLAREAARKWWLIEISDTKRFLEARLKERTGQDGHGETSESTTLTSQRPSLNRVKKILEDVKLMEMGSRRGEVKM